MSTHLLVLNAGSSSLKFALFPLRSPEHAEMSGRVERIGTANAKLVARDGATGQAAERAIAARDHGEAFAAMLKQCATAVPLEELAALGHRVVHGGTHLTEPVRIDAGVVQQLRQFAPYDPTHQRPALALIETAAERWPQLPQVACFDTTFHVRMPAVAHRVAIPRAIAERGVRRYGFHGLSYTHLMEELQRVDGNVARQGRIILAHLGSGASLAAVGAGQPLDTTMGFTPNSGLPMSSRSGELDPGLVLWLAREDHMTPEQIFALASQRSGLLGVSETSGDVRELLAREREDPRAAEAVELFCYQVRKTIGAFAAALGGVDILVFSGGIGEHAAVIRERICAGLEFLGIAIDARANAAHATMISNHAARVAVRVIAADEERIVARETRRVLGL